MRLLAVGVLLLAAAAGGCHKRDRDPVPSPRLVTFSPALTQMVFDMGLGAHVVGVTSYCTLPPGEHRIVVGNQLKVRAEPILSVRPDAVLTQTEAKSFEPVRKIDPGVRIEHFEIETLTDVGAAMERIGRIAGRPELGRQTRKAFSDKLLQVKQAVADRGRRRVAFISGYRRPFAPGKGTFVHEMIELAGGINVIGLRYEGWKNPTIEAIVQLVPQVIICQSKPAEAAAAGKYWKELGKRSGTWSDSVVVVTDDNWTIPGRHLADLAVELAAMIHPRPADPETQP